MKELTYKLIDIEVWSYDYKNFPQLIITYNFINFIGKKYTKNELNKIEHTLKKKINNAGYFVQSIMNPLYLESRTTVISLDISPNKTRKFYNNIPPKLQNIDKNIEKLLTRHQRRLNYIFKSGHGNVERFNKDTVLFSKDKKLYDIEQQISKILYNKTNLTNHILKHDSLNLLRSLQWIKKDTRTLNLYLKKINTGNEAEINIILLQIIPLINDLPIIFKKRLANILLNKLILLPSSTIRNKALSILSEIPQSINTNQKFHKFLKIQVQSKQLNCSYPAREILEALNNEC